MKGKQYILRKEMRRGKKIRLICSCFILLTVFLLGGCGAKEQADSSKVQSVEATATPTATPVPTPEPTPEPTATPAPTATPEPIVLDAAFDEAFELVFDRKYYVGRDDVSITIDEKYTYIETIQAISYTLNVGDEKYEGEIRWSKEDGLEVRQPRFSMNRVLCEAFDYDEGKVTLLITETTDIQEPLVLSGNPEDTYITTRPEYVEREDYIIFMDTGTKIYGNTPELIEEIFRMVEEESGLSRDAELNYLPLENDILKWLFIRDEFIGVDTEVEKYHIYVVPTSVCTPMGGYGYMIINPEELEIAAGNAYPIVHEYAHGLHAANGPWMSQIMNEGFSTYITAQVIGREGSIPFKYDAYKDYSDFSIKLTKDNVEKNFLEGPEYGFVNYAFGFRLMHFLMETYGEDIFKKLLDEACIMVAEDWNEIYREETLECLKRCTSETVLEEFVDWYAENKSRFK